MRFDLTDLKLFLNVADVSSITHGAARSNMSVSSASERITRMEASLGAPLLDRQRRGVQPTPAGLALRDHARTILNDVDRMLIELSEHAKGLRGRVRILSNTAAVTEFLPDMISDYLAEHPQIDVELEELSSHEIVRQVAMGLADAGIVADTFDLGELQVFPLAEDVLVLVVPETDPLARQQSVKFQDVTEREFVGLPKASGLQIHIEENAMRIGVTLKVRIRLTTFDNICRSVSRGVGLAVIPEAAARRCCETTGVRTIRLAEAWAKRHLKICVRDVEALSPHAEQVVSYLRSHEL